MATEPLEVVVVFDWKPREFLTSEELKRRLEVGFRWTVIIKIEDHPVVGLRLSHLLRLRSVMLMYPENGLVMKAPYLLEVITKIPV